MSTAGPPPPPPPAGPPGPPPGYPPGSPPYYTTPPPTGPYGYGAPATPPPARRSPLLWIVILAVVGLLVGAAIVLGLNLLRPSATPTPTPLPTLAPTPTQPAATATAPPTLAPTASPTAPPTASPTLPPTSSPTATASPTADRQREIERLLALVPAEFRDSCSDFTASERPSISCFTDGISHFYDSYQSIDELRSAFDIRLDLRGISTDDPSCFDDPTPSPCEGGYAVGDLDPAGRVGAATDADGSHWVVYTHDHALVLGTLLSSSREYGEVFEFWADDLILEYEP